MLLFDAHCHLPKHGGLRPIHPRVLCGTNEGDWEAVLTHATSGPQVIPMLGLHPWQVQDAHRDWASTLDALLRAHKAGVGECGLDFARKESDPALQEAAFRAQLRLAQALHRPVAIHAVRAWGPLLQILREEGVPSAGALVHAFSGSAETARALQSMGLHLSFSGDLLKPNRPRLLAALRAVSSGHLLLETDGAVGLDLLCEAAAVARGTSPEQLAAQTWENGQRCFKELMA